MPWKMDENGVLTKDDKGNPVWIHADGNELGFDYTLYSTAKREAVERKEKLRELEGRFEPFKGIESPQEWLAEAQKALETVASAPDAQKAVEDQIRARVEAATKPLNERLSASVKENETLRKQFEAEAVGNAFARSAFVREKMADPALAADLFKGRFTMKDGQVVAIGDDGQPIFGENGVASFDEAMAKMVDSSPYKLILLKGSTANGGGAAPGSGGGAPGGSRASSLKQLKKPADKAKFISEHGLDAFKNLPAE